MNPCRCGYLGDPERECTKAPRCGGDYQAKLSGPLLDRIDVQVEVPAVQISDLNKQKGEPSAVVADRVAKAREIQLSRFQALGASETTSVNAHVKAEILEEVMPLSAEAKELLNKAAEKMKLSARSYYRLIRVARTIADLEGEAGNIAPAHIAESLSYRKINLNY